MNDEMALNNCALENEILNLRKILKMSIDDKQKLQEIKHELLYQIAHLRSENERLKAENEELKSTINDFVVMTRTIFGNEKPHDVCVENPQPHKCPICEGKKEIKNNNQTPGCFKIEDIGHIINIATFCDICSDIRMAWEENYSYYYPCNVCEGKGVLWR